MLKLYGTPPMRVIRPIWLLNALDLECEIVPVDMFSGENLLPSYLAINPVGKIPALVDGDLILAESVPIMLHLAEIHGDGRFIPTDARGRALMNQWNSFLITEIEAPLWRIALHGGIYPEADRSPAEIELASRDLRRVLAVLEAALDNREQLVGSTLTVADFNAAYTLDWAGEAGMLDQSPNCRRFVEAMYARPDAPPRIGEAFPVLMSGQIPPRYRSELTDTSDVVAA